MAELVVAHFDMVAACEYGPSGWCTNGRHEKCAHRAGGPQEAGVWSPECYVTIGNKPNGKTAVPAGWPTVIQPSHIWRCPCECHSAPVDDEPNDLLDLLAVDGA